MADQPTPTFIRRIDELNVPRGMLALGALGQSGFAIKAGQTIAYIDPYLSDSFAGIGGPSRRIPIVVEPGSVTHADVILCTHEHIDHTDVDTLVPLAAASPSAPIAGSIQSRDMLAQAGVAADRIQTPTLGQTLTFGDFTVTPVPAAHYDYEVDAEGHSRWMGFVVEANGVTLYHAGDTILVPELIEAISRYRLDLALLPVNGRDYFREQQDIVGNLSPREIAHLCRQLAPRVLIPIHNDLFAENRVNPAELVMELERVVPMQRFHFLQAGEIYLYCG